MRIQVYYRDSLAGRAAAAAAAGCLIPRLYFRYLYSVTGPGSPLGTRACPASLRVRPGPAVGPGRGRSVTETRLAAPFAGVTPSASPSEPAALSDSECD